MQSFDIVAHVSRIEANRSLKDAMLRTLGERRPPYRISVTDLLNLKQAYFKRKYPEITPSLEKQQLLWAGTGFHAVFGSAISSEEYLEQFVEVDSIVGKIDIFEKLPVEVKTTSSLHGSTDLLSQRPAYIEQLGMYCAMVAAHQGQIVIYERQPGQSPRRGPLLLYHVAFPNLDTIREEMRKRRDLLLHALISNDPSSLPSCPWHNRGCDYSGVCDCDTSELAWANTIAALADEVRMDESASERLLERLATPGPSGTITINDVVFPRKALLRRRDEARRKQEDEEPPIDKGDQLRSIDERGFLAALRDSLRYGVPGKCQRVPVRHASLTDLVQVWQEMPTVLRDPKFSTLVDRQRLPRTFPHYFSRLAFECALTGTPQGRLLLYYSRVPKEDAKLMVYDVSFRDLGAVKSEASRRIELLEQAASVLDLPECPSWMCQKCRHRSECTQV